MPYLRGGKKIWRWNTVGSNLAAERHTGQDGGEESVHVIMHTHVVRICRWFSQERCHGFHGVLERCGADAVAVAASANSLDRRTPSPISHHVARRRGLGCCQVYNTPRIYPQKRTGQEHPLTSPLIHHINTMTK
ncbi:unnamed protein product [Arctogadus glacialis]